MAYPIVGEAKIARARRLMARARILLSVDSFAGAEALGAGMAEAGTVADVLVIVDTGYHRCGVAAGEAADFGAAIAPLPGLRLRGTDHPRGPCLLQARRGGPPTTPRWTPGS